MVVQRMLSSSTAVLAETGDSWFNCQKLKLPKGCGLVLYLPAEQCCYPTLCTRCNRSGQCWTAMLAQSASPLHDP